MKLTNDTLNQEEREWEKEFDAHFSPYIRGLTLKDRLKDFIRSIQETERITMGLTCSKIALEEIAEAEKRGYERAMREMTRVQKHETRKLLDGFAHPKDCEDCSLLDNK